MLVIGVGARSNAFHSRRLKRASRKLICACRSGRRRERCATGLAGTLRVDAEEALASPHVTELIPRTDEFSCVLSGFHLHPGPMSPSLLAALTELLWKQTASHLLSDATEVTGGNKRCTLTSSENTREI